MQPVKVAVALAAVLALVPGACSSKAPAPTIAQSGALGVTVQYVPDPPAPGVETITVGVHDSAGKPVDGAHVEVYTAMGAMNMNGKSVVARPNGNGLYAAVIEFGTATRWLFSITAKAGGRMGTAHVAVDLK